MSRSSSTSSSNRSVSVIWCECAVEPASNNLSGAGLCGPLLWQGRVIRSLATATVITRNSRFLLLSLLYDILKHSPFIWDIHNIHTYTTFCQTSSLSPVQSSSFPFTWKDQPKVYDRCGDRSKLNMSWKLIKLISCASSKLFSDNAGTAGLVSAGATRLAKAGNLSSPSRRDSFSRLWSIANLHFCNIVFSLIKDV